MHSPDDIREQWKRERPDLDTEPMALLGRIERLAAELEGRFAPTFARLGLTAADFDVLATLRRAGTPFRLTPTELGRAMMVSAPGVTKRVDRLEQRGLIRRRPSPSDRRSTVIELTSKGRRLVDEAVTAHVADEKSVVSVLSASDRKRLAALLDALSSGGT